MRLKRNKPTVKSPSTYKVRLVIANLREMRKTARKLKKERGVGTIPLEEFFKYWIPELKAIPCGGIKGFIRKWRKF